MRPAILIFLGHYLPGYKAGGALRTVANVAEALSDEFSFKIVTADRDIGDPQPYPSVTVDRWQSAGNADVLYLAPGALTLTRCKAILDNTPHRLLYLQSAFAGFTRMPLTALRSGYAKSSAPIVIAPRGELYAGALATRRLKKYTYLLAARAAGLYTGVTWQASNADEAAAIRQWFGQSATIVIAPDLASAAPAAGVPKTNPKTNPNPKVPGHLKILFLSRICPKKNLTAALQILRNTRARIAFDIYGPREDEGYWKICQNLIADLPANVECRYRGTVPHEQVSATLSQYDLFLFPTMGENFGHVILESLLAGCPVAVSDQTPWRGLRDSRAGWDLPLDRPEAFTKIVEACAALDDAEYSRLREGARARGHAYTNDGEVLEANRRLFRDALRRQP